jgi:23S rRNA pseudouridine1911/1915/1917 synthase
VLKILYEDNHLVFVDKPAGMLAQGDITGDLNVVDYLKAYRKKHENKPGEAFVGLVHRLDRPVSGVMVLAKTSKAAQRLNEAWQTPAVEKRYRALVSHSGALPSDDWETWHDRLRKDVKTNIVERLSANDVSKDSQEAVLEIRTISRFKDQAELEIRLGTGRGHQIRVQLAGRGLPIVGDLKYGSKMKLADSRGHGRIALHAHYLRVPHPTLKTPVEVLAELPPQWPGA